MSWNLLSWIGIGFLSLGAFLALREHTWLRSAHVAPGTIIELVEHRSSKGKTTYRPRIRYLTPDGTFHEFTRGYGSSPPEFAVGDHVFVAYDKAAPTAARILTFGQRYGVPVFLILLGAVMFVMAITFIIGPTFVPKIYLK